MKNLPTKAILLHVLMVMVQADLHPNHDHHHHHHRGGHQKMHTSKKIHNGRRTERGEGKFMAAILYPPAGRLNPVEHFICSAVVITEDTLLTAGHCLVNFSTAQVRRLEVLPGGLQLHSYHTYDFLVRKIENFWIHPSWDRKSPPYDIAIFEVGPQPWRLGPLVETALMPVRIKAMSNYRPKQYGYGENAHYTISGNLNVIELKQIWGQELCKRGFHTTRPLLEPDVVFCSSNFRPYTLPSGPSSGDSGGGITIHGLVERTDKLGQKTILKSGEVLVGIHSSGTLIPLNYADLQRPYFSYHNNVTTLIRWIASRVGVQFETYHFEPNS